MSLSLEDLGFTSISGKVVLLTGASSGMGRCAALLLAKAGVKLCLMARRKERLDELSQEIEKESSIKPITFFGDVRDEQACNECVAACIEKFGRIDVLINNAGVGYPTDLETVDTATYKAMMETNVDGVVFMTRAALPHLKKQKKGDIIMISSPAGWRANPVAPLYCSSKFALEGYTEGLRLQLNQLHEKGIHIRVMNILPGATNSEYWGERNVPREKFMTSEEMGSIILQAVATKETVLVKNYQVEEFRYGQ
jgi:NADP-dependent 3-hydroxy acid dehydrogenase YdfG